MPNSLTGFYRFLRYRVRAESFTLSLHEHDLLL